MPPVTIRGADVRVAEIQEAIRERVRLRRAGGLPVPRADVDALLSSRLEALRGWNFPDQVWAAMWPPNLLPWNLEQPYPIRSHRGVLGRLLVTGKRLLRALLRVVLRPLLTQQVEINRALALVTLSLADELAEERLHLRALEQRLARTGSLLRGLRGEEEPLVVFAGSPSPPRSGDRPA